MLLQRSPAENFYQKSDNHTPVPSKNIAAPNTGFICTNLEPLQ